MLGLGQGALLVLYVIRAGRSLPRLAVQWPEQRPLQGCHSCAGGGGGGRGNGDGSASPNACRGRVKLFVCTYFSSSSTQSCRFKLSLVCASQARLSVAGVGIMCPTYLRTSGMYFIPT